jgi:hypothetical protein
MLLACGFDQECLKSSWCLCCLGNQRNVENVETNDKRHRVYTERFYVLNAALRYLAYSRGPNTFNSHTLPLLKHQSHLNNFRPKVISKFSDVRTIAILDVVTPENILARTHPSILFSFLITSSQGFRIHKFSLRHRSLSILNLKKNRQSQIKAIV